MLRIKNLRDNDLEIIFYFKTSSKFKNNFLGEAIFSSKVLFQIFPKNKFFNVFSGVGYKTI